MTAKKNNGTKFSTGNQTECTTTSEGRFELRYILNRENGYVRYIANLDKENAYRIAEQLSKVSLSGIVHIFDHDESLIDTYDDGGLMKNGAPTHEVEDGKGGTVRVSIPKD